MDRGEVESYLLKIPGWVLVEDGKAIRHEYVMKNFMSGIEFANKIAGLAEQEDHHPDLHLTGYRKFTVELSTHSIGGISMNDLILASKIETLPKELKK